ncbi:MAG: hypothetical protein CME64_02220 [Halobacteriovoraceae bacterium]|nr:hypothetical protein [Halobacteriovoraceae bacterium]|tara:strand:+ start:22983 stop:24944 length:1962 start_codon:yes stop_codon:yes gene_type:complete
MKVFLKAFLFTLAFAASPAFSTVKHIVIDMDGVLVKEVPSWNKNEYPASSRVWASPFSSPFTNLYIKKPHVSEFFLRLQRENSIVPHFVTRNSHDWAVSILDGFSLPAPFKDSLSAHFTKYSANRILSHDDLVDGVLDLNKITSDTDNVIVVTNDLKYFGGKDSPNRVALPKELWYFNSFEDAMEYKDSLNDAEWDLKKENMPKTEKEWSLEQYKLASLMAKFIDLDLFLSDRAVSLTDEINSYEESDAYEFGQVLAQNNFYKEAYKWVFNQDKSQVLGCELYSLKEDRKLNDSPMEDCINVLTTELAFDFNQDDYTVNACYQRETAHGAVLSERPLNDCLNGDELSHYWIKSKNDKKCAVFINDLFYFGEASDSLCGLFVYNIKDGTPVIEMDMDYFGTSGVASIISLRDSEVIPEQFFEQYEVNQIATSLIIRKHKSEAKERKPGYDYFNDTKIAIAFDSEWTQEILEKGFLNQHRLPHSNGFFGPTYRAEAEDRFLGLKIEKSYGNIGTKAHNLRPKYAFLLLKKASDQTGYTQIYSGYGNVYAIIKDEVKNRSTFTLEDSLNYNIGKDDVRTFFVRPKHPLRLASKYFETQMWGTLDLKNVSHFLVDCPHVTNVRSDTLRALKATGKPVYQCQTKVKNKPYLVYKGKQL